MPHGLFAIDLEIALTIAKEDATTAKGNVRDMDGHARERHERLQLAAK